MMSIFGFLTLKNRLSRNINITILYEGDFGKKDWKPCGHVVSRIIKSGDKCYYSVYNNPLMEVYQINIENTDTKKVWK